MRPTLYYLALMTTCIILSSCQKEPDGGTNNPPQVTCKLDRAYYYDDPGTAGYVYYGTQATRINLQDYYSTLEYSGNKITHRNYFDYGGTPTPLGQDVITYMRIIR